MGCPPCVEVPAMRASLGNEATIEAFIWHLLLVMRELKRVLRDDGVCWVNLGDSFISAKSRYKNTPQTIHNQDMRGERNMRGLPEDSIDFYHQGYGDGNLAMVPHRFALAAQADGWTLRNDCVWPMREARHGRLFLSDGSTLKISNAQYQNDHSVIDANSPSPLSQKHLKSYLHHLSRIGERYFEVIACLQNVSVTLLHMKNLRERILQSK
jgi:hypothetical protein